MSTGPFSRPRADKDRGTICCPPAEIFYTAGRANGRVAFLQSLKHHIHRRLKFQVILAGLAGIYHFSSNVEVHFFLRRFLPDIADQAAEQPFRFHPKIFRAFFRPRPWCCRSRCLPAFNTSFSECRYQETGCISCSEKLMVFSTFTR